MTDDDRAALKHNVTALGEIRTDYFPGKPANGDWYATWHQLSVLAEQTPLQPQELVDLLLGTRRLLYAVRRAWPDSIKDDTDLQFEIK